MVVGLRKQQRVDLHMIDFDPTPFFYGTGLEHVMEWIW